MRRQKHIEEVFPHIEEEFLNLPGLLGKMSDHISAVHMSKSFWSRSAHVFAVGSVALVGGKLEFLKYPNCWPVFALQYEFSVLTFPIFRIEKDSGFRVFPLDPVLFSNLLKNHILKFVHRQCSRMCSRDFSVVSVLFRRSASDSHLFRYRR